MPILFSISEIVRPVTSATPPPLARCRCVIRSRSAVSTKTASGVAAISIRVPSISRKKAHSTLAAGGDLWRIVTSPGACLPRQDRAAGDRGSIEQHAARPAKDVELGYQSAHQAHAVALFGIRHGQRQMQGGSALVGIVRVDNQCLRQLAGSAGELGKNQRAALVVARSDKFLGDQVHAVVQAADETQIGRAEIFIHLMRSVVLDLEYDR